MAPAVQSRNLAIFRQGRVLVAAPIGSGQGRASQPGEALIVVNLGRPGGDGVPCPGPSTVQAVDVHLASGDAGLLVPLPDAISVCGVDAGSSQFFAPEVALNKTLSPITARIVAPREVRAGTQSRYEVVLTNAALESVRFSESCPNYREDLQPVGAGKLRFQLTCAALPELAPGESRMVLAVPPRCQPAAMTSFGR